MTTTLPHNASAMIEIQKPKQNDTTQIETTLPQDLLKIKEISEKLNLSTRRPSVIQWKKVIENRKCMGHFSSSSPITDVDGAVENQDPETISENHEKMSKFEIKSVQVNGIFLEEDKNSPSQKLSSDVSEALVPTPIRRMRRAGQTAISPLSLSENVLGGKLPLENNELIEEKTDASRSRDVRANQSDDSESKTNQSDVATRYNNINQSFEKIRRDLMLMRIEDNKLARKLLDIRGEMNVVRAQCSCQEHAVMLDYVATELEEEEELTGLIKACDLSDGKPSSLLFHFSPLRNIGVSRMNLNTRRFSIR